MEQRIAEDFVLLSFSLVAFDLSTEEAWASWAATGWQLKRIMAARDRQVFRAGVRKSIASFNSRTSHRMDVAYVAWPTACWTHLDSSDAIFHGSLWSTTNHGHKLYPIDRCWWCCWYLHPVMIFASGPVRRNPGGPWFEAQTSELSSWVILSPSWSIKLWWVVMVF